MTPEQVAAKTAAIAADVAARIAKADQEVFDSAAAFAAGRFPEYWDLRAEEVRKRLEGAGASAMERAAVAAGRAGGASG